MATSINNIRRIEDKILEIREALRIHRKATVYDSRIQAMFGELDALRSVVIQDLRSNGLETLFSGSDDSLKTLIGTASGTRPNKSRLMSQLKSGELAIRKLKTTLEAQSAPPDYYRLKLRVDSLQDGVLREILEEAFRCWWITSTRACIVLSWCAVEAKIFDIYRRWTIPKIKTLDPELNRNKIKVHEDLATVPDAYLLRGLRKARVLTPTEYNILNGVCNTYRGIAAHAGRRKPLEDSEVSTTVGNMIDFVEKAI